MSVPLKSKVLWIMERLKRWFRMSSRKPPEKANDIKRDAHMIAAFDETW